MSFLPETEQVTVTERTEGDNASTFVIEPLAPGYGMTIGHSLRRVLLTSLKGAAVSFVKIAGADHEFTTVKGMREDVVELILNLKSLRVHSHSDEPIVVKLEKKGAGKVTAADFSSHADIEIADPSHYLATLDADGKLSMEVTIETGRGYQPAERKTQEKLPIGTIAVDSIYTPIKRVHYDVEHTRVGGQTDFDKLTLELMTDGTVTPAEAMKHASNILIEHYQIVSAAAEQAIEANATEAPVKKSKAKKKVKSEK